MLKMLPNRAQAALKTTPRTSLIISFYNRIDFLKLVWASVESQSNREFQVIICDDGSSESVVGEVQDLIRDSRLPVMHLWHPDQGFRKNRILNQGILWAQAPHLVFIDGDCVLHPQFVSEHMHFARPKTVLAGRRMDLSPGLTRLLTPERVRAGYLEKNLWWIIPLISWRKDNNGLKAIYIENTKLRSWLNKKPRGIVGCNFSVQKMDMLAINGFDNRYEAPGTGEDSDIEYRLRLNGVKIQPFCNAAIQYHLWHRLQKRPSGNEDLFREVQRLEKARTEFGLEQVGPNG